MWLWIASAALAAEHYVPREYTTLGDAVAYAYDGDTIYLDPTSYDATYDEFGVAIVIDLTIASDTEGMNAPLPTLLVYGATLTLQDVSLNTAALSGFDIGDGVADIGLYLQEATVDINRGSLSVPEGTAIYTQETELTLTDVALGGQEDLPSIYGTYGSVTLQGGDEDGCTNANNAGAPILALLETDVTIVGCSFTDNRADRDARWTSLLQAMGYSTSKYAAGGALWLLGETSQLEVSDTTFARHSAEDDGGVAIVSIDSSWTNVTIEEADANLFGGAVRLTTLSGTSASHTFSGVQFTDVEAYGGGALAGDAADITLQDGVTVEGADADKGGAYYLAEGSLQILGGTYNFVHADYGGVVWAQDASLTLQDLDLQGPGVPSEQGGAVLGQDVDATFSNVEFFNFDTKNQGGAVSIYGTSAVQLSAVGFDANQADEGGAYHQEDGTLTATEVLFSSNAAQTGAGMMLEGLEGVELDHGWFCENTAEDGGSAMHVAVDNGVEASLSHLGVIGNVTIDGSALTLSGDGSYTVTQSTLSDNEGPGSMIGAVSDVEVTNTILVGGIRGISGRGLVNGGYNLWYDQDEEPAGTGALLPSADAVFDAPRFVLREPTCDADVHLRPGSPAIDAGDPALSDADGSRSDMGVYGGENADKPIYGDTGWIDTADTDTEETVDTAQPQDSGLPNLPIDRVFLRNGCSSMPVLGWWGLPALVFLVRRRAP